jgi:hypothetical protein
MQLRFEGQAAEDYESIYHSSHRLSTLRRSFPTLKEYLCFAREQLKGQIKITAFDLIADQQIGKKAYVLCRVSMTVQNTTETFTEVAELQRSVLGWRFLHCARLPLELMPETSLAIDLKTLFSHPKAVIY